MRGQSDVGSFYPWVVCDESGETGRVCVARNQHTSEYGTRFHESLRGSYALAYQAAEDECRQFSRLSGGEHPVLPANPVPGALWLVLLSHTLDDLPLRLFADEAEAIAYADRVEPADGESVCKVLRIDATTPICVKVLKFELTPNGLVPVNVAVLEKEFA